MGVTQLFERRVLFSPNIPNAVDYLLQAAVAVSSVDQTKAENLFLQAQALDKQCLQTYFALYKFYFFQKRLVDAEKIVLSALDESARQGSFPSDFRRLVIEGQKWDLYASETTLFYLYTLKALAFIKLRQGYNSDAQLILSHLRQLDPEDLIGASVIMDLAAGVSE
jgi:tetratricopeptide (TPR) repeat protein